MNWETVDWENDVAFCPESLERPTLGEIAFRIGLDLFDSTNFEEIVKVRYEQMKQKFKNVSYEDYGCPKCSDRISRHLKNIENPKKPDARLSVDAEILESNIPEVRDLFSQPRLGHDLPVWLSISKPLRSFRKIMIISEDPKREEGESGMLSVSTPFGVHCATYRQHTQKDLSFRLIEHLLASYGIVYLTDARKLYAGANGKYIRNEIQNKHGYFRRSFDHILDDVEISSFDPDLILAMGNDVVDPRFTNSVLSKAHFFKEGCEIQTIDFAGNREIHVVTTCHPALASGRIKNKDGKLLPAGRNIASFSGCDGTGEEIKEAYFERVLEGIDEYLQ